jgi:uncharacterized protein YdhG (YjbR/CyaY superfamily)
MPAEGVDRYLAALPADQRAALQGLREQILALAPEAVEGISYGMPAYKVDGKPLVYFAAAKAHCGLYGNNARFLAPDELARIDHSKGTLRFTPDSPLPETIVEKVVRGRLREITY